MTTSTRIKYNVSPNLDEIVHDYKSNTPIIKLVHLQGEDGFISSLSCRDEMGAIFGSIDLSDINATYKLITDCDTHFWRLNNVITAVELPLALGGGFVVYGGRFDGQRLARGVVVERAESSIGNGSQ